MNVKEYKKEELFVVSESLTPTNIKELLDNLVSKDDKLRYNSFLILQYRSENRNDLYPYFDRFLNMLKSDNSYHIIIGLKLISINIKWDKDNKLEKIIDDYLSYCEDEKLITARLAIQGLNDIIKYSNYNKKILDKIVSKLISIDISKRPSTHLKVMTTDIVNILIEIEKEADYKEITVYLKDCLEQNIIDKNLKKAILELLN